MKLDADVAVIGCGAMGSMSLWRLAARGTRVIGFERFQPGYAMGSSHGETRIIRTAYHEGAEYVPLVQEAWGLWRGLEQETGESLAVRNGGLMIGAPTCEVVAGALASARLHGLEHRVLDADEMRRRHPQHSLADDEVAVEEPGAGFILPELAVATAARRAVALGAVLHTGCTVRRIEPDAASVTIHSDAGTHRVRHAVIAAGPWTSDVAPWAELPLAVTRQAMGWYRVADPAPFDPSRFPIWIHETAEHVGYGFPTLDGRTVKVALHGEGGVADPVSLDREAHASDSAPLDGFVSKVLGGVDPSVAEMTVCMYTNTPDHHFAIGPLEGIPNVTLISACSGHGFKFAPVIGDLAADWALEGGTHRNITLFNPNRWK